MNLISSRITGGLARQAAGYLVVSVVALGADAGLLWWLSGFAGVDYRVAAGIGFAVGLAVNYLLSIRFVFHNHRLRDRRIEFLGFAVIGLLGWALNEAIIILGVQTFKLAPIVAKVPATAVGFVFNFGLRRALLFSQSIKR